MLRNSRDVEAWVKVEGIVMDNHKLIHQDSGNVEYYTPREIVQAASELMGGITLDPACSWQAWEWHGQHSMHYCDHDKNGLVTQWFGNVWMNHPFSRAENEQWIARFVGSYDAALVATACCITFASTSAGWFNPLKKHPQFFFDKRVNYFNPLVGKIDRGVTKDSVFTWLRPEKMWYDEACDLMEKVMKKHGYEGTAK